MERESARNWDWLTAILLFLLLQVCTARLVTTDWAPNLYFTERTAAVGTIVGLALGASRFGGRARFWLAFAYTVVLVPWQMSSAADNDLLLDRLAGVGNTLAVSFGQFMQRQPVRDPLFFVAFVALVFWLLALIAGYQAARNGNILVGIIPAGAILLVVQVYANYQLHGSWWLGTYLVIALLMIGRAYFLQSEKTWAKRRVYVNEESWTNILGGLFMTVTVVIIIAWALPTSITSVQGVTDAWTRMTRGVRDRLSNAVTSLKGEGSEGGANFFGSDMALGRVAASGDEPVFTVDVLRAPAGYARYYWRGRVYDTYDNGAWSTSSSSTLPFEPTDNSLPVADIENHSEADIRFTVQFPTQTLIYAPAEPVWVDRGADVNVTPVERGLNDVLSWVALSSLQAGNHYEVRSQIGDPNVVQLRAAAGPYPKWIQDRYLQVPADVRPSIQRLAQQVTAGQPTSFDKAVAITNYLRANLQYATAVPPAPEGLDPVEWVLFTYKKGFCNYYASAEVLMLRSVGIPARLAVGFAQGEYVAGTYVVRRRDAHAWPEVFFPALGWVEFEPTTSQQPLVRIDPNAVAAPGGVTRRPNPLGEGDAGSLRPEPTPLAPVGGTSSPASPLGVLLVSLLVVAVALTLYLIYRHRAMRFVPIYLDRAFERTGLSTPAWLEGWLHWNRLEPVEQAFAPVTWSLRWLGKAPSIDATPAERVAALKELMPLAVESIDAVASELEIGLFTPGTPDVPRARQAGMRILVELVRTRIRNFLGV